jgi:hypothetical protein
MMGPRQSSAASGVPLGGYLVAASGLVVIARLALTD